MAPDLSILPLLQLERIGDDRYRSAAPHRLAHAEVDATDDNRDAQVQRVYGGQLLAQALSAATSTVEDLRVHSLHAYFLRGATSDSSIDFVVRRTKDGRSFTQRMVEVVQDQRTLVTLSA